MPKDKVIFRVFEPEGDVIALFPGMPEGTGFINSYQHIGQHGAATPSLIKELRPATEEEYLPLLKELRQIGYSV